MDWYSSQRETFEGRERNRVASRHVIGALFYLCAPASDVFAPCDARAQAYVGGRAVVPVGDRVFDVSTAHDVIGILYQRGGAAWEIVEASAAACRCSIIARVGYDCLWVGWGSSGIEPKDCFVRS